MSSEQARCFASIKYAAPDVLTCRGADIIYWLQSLPAAVITSSRQRVAGNIIEHASRTMWPESLDQRQQREHRLALYLRLRQPFHRALAMQAILDELAKYDEQ